MTEEGGKEKKLRYIGKKTSTKNIVASKPCDCWYIIFMFMLSENSRGEIDR